MNKKRIGAALSLVAAVSAGATAYASTINNLESDKNTNAIFTPSYSDNTYDYNFVKSDYTNDLKNTAIANEKRTVQNTSKQEEDVAKVEENAKNILKTSVINIVAKEKASQNEEESTEVEDVESEVESPEVNDEEVIAYDGSQVSESNVNTKDDLEEIQADNEENLDNEETEEESKEEDVVAYDDSNLDSDSDKENEQELEVSEANDEVVNYLDENSKEVDIEDNEEVNQKISKFVNVEALYIRSSKSMADNSNVLRTLAAGDKVDGVIEGEWLKIDEGYLNLKYLSNDYPQSLVDSIKSKKAQESKKQEEANEAKKLEEKEVKVEEKQESPVQYGTPFTGWVHNTAAINVREQAKTGKIIGTLAKGAKVDGQIANGWVKTTYNGRTAFVSAYYLTTQEADLQEKQAENQKIEEKVVQQQAQAEENKTKQNQNNDKSAASEQVVDEETIVEEQAQKAPAVNQNGQQAANIACQFAGSPYVWGASSPSVGFDCSGLVTYAYNQLGVSLPHSSQAQFNNGYAVGINNLQPGDLVFFSNHSGIDHVGIVTSSDGTFIHASTPRSGVKYDNVYSNYYQKVFAGARRIF